MADQTLVKTFTDIADAIRAKDGSTGTMKPTEMPGKIAAIETGTDTSDATVTASDLASGVVAYGKDGKVTGNVSVITNFFQNGTAEIIRYFPNATDISESQFLVDSPKVPFPILIRTSSGQRVLIKGSDFGDATAADVVTGKTFTSASGLKVTGTGKLATTGSYLTDNTVSGTRVSDVVFSMSIPVSKLSVQKTPVSLKTLTVHFNTTSSIPDCAITKLILVGHNGEAFFNEQSSKIRAHVVWENKTSGGSVYYTVDLSPESSVQPSTYGYYMAYNPTTNAIDIAVNIYYYQAGVFKTSMNNFIVSGMGDTIFGV